MSHFYGTLQGHRGEATRCGSKDGLRTVAASWSGAIATQLYVRNGVDCARISHTTWRGSGVCKLIYDGPINPGWNEPAAKERDEYEYGV